MILILCGMSCTGKTSAMQGLVEKYDYDPIVTYTTRPIREGEKEGVTYHYIDQQTFSTLLNSGFFIETTQYKVASSEIWYYGTSVASIREAKSNSVIILNPDGLIKILSIIGKEKVCICYLTANEKTILGRSKARGDDKLEAYRRLEADKKDFRDVGDYADIVIPTDNDTIDKIISDIDMYYHVYKAGKE